MSALDRSSFVPLIRGRAIQSNDLHYLYYVIQAALLEEASSTKDGAVAARCHLLALHAFYKTAAMCSKQMKLLGLQTTPFLQGELCYHRTCESDLLEEVKEAFADALRLEQIVLLPNDGARSLLARRGYFVEVSHDGELQECLEKWLEKSGPFLVDITDWGISELGFRMSLDGVVRNLTLFNSGYSKLKSKIVPVRFLQHKGICVLHLMGGDDELLERIDRDLSLAGCRLGSAQAKEAWLKVETFESILKQASVSVAKLGVKRLPSIASVENLLQVDAAKKFALMDGAVVKTTLRLLAGLKENKSAFASKAYGRIAVWMEGADRIHPAQFVNAIEAIHQEIQSILYHTPIYKGGDLEAELIKRVPTDLPKIGFVKGSGMQALASAVTATEQQKGSPLRIAVQDGVYYEAPMLLGKTVDPDSGSIDLFLCEFHHNISVDRIQYGVEPLLKQIKALLRGGKMANPCTVVIDTTMDLERSSELKALLSDKEVIALVGEGKLNLLLFCSAQKYHTLGMDNISGGFAVAINNQDKFAAFNKSMGSGAHDGLSVQTLSHYMIAGGDGVDLYRQELLERGAYLYKKIPKKMLSSKGNSNPIQVSLMEGERVSFLQIRSDSDPHLPLIVGSALLRKAQKGEMLVTNRPSFGFLTTNIADIGKGMRITPGIDRSTLDCIAACFQEIQKEIDRPSQDALRGRLRDLLLPH